MPISWSDADYAEVAALQARYAITLDRGDAAGLGACFAGDATLLVDGAEVCRGRAEIASRLTSRSDPAVLHFPFPPAQEGMRGGRMLSRSYFQLVDTREGRITGVGTYDDEIIRSTDGLALASRSVTYSWKAAAR